MVNIEQRHIVGIVIGVLILIADFLFFVKTPWLIPLIVIALTMGWSQFWIDFFVNRRKQKDIEERFPDFVRNLVGAIKSGMPVSKAIIYVSRSDYGALTTHVVKLANQCEWSIPVHKALTNFSAETKNPVIKRAISTVIEAEQSGGNIEDVLETITSSVIEIKRIKLERQASIHGQLVQSYVIFIVFLGVMIVIQNLLIPYIADIQTKGATEFGAGEETVQLQSGGALAALLQKVEMDYSSPKALILSFTRWLTSIRGVFLMLALIQALFAGLVLGKLAEGEIRAGVKHSLILMTIAFFVISLAQGALTYGK
ncbi:type II secretion system F family protein [Candidatus Woesearchaeota archaeon]|nr:type II secretion system F family protein [Candidatus Woesearchaeota archaeon]